jgi:hypothetical protein
MFQPHLNLLIFELSSPPNGDYGSGITAAYWVGGQQTASVTFF